MLSSYETDLFLNHFRSSFFPHKHPVLFIYLLLVLFSFAMLFVCFCFSRWCLWLASWLVWVFLVIVVLTSFVIFGVHRPTVSHLIITPLYTLQEDGLSHVSWIPLKLILQCCKPVVQQEESIFPQDHAMLVVTSIRPVSQYSVKYISIIGVVFVCLIDCFLFCFFVFSNIWLWKRAIKSQGFSLW